MARPPEIAAELAALWRAIEALTLEVSELRAALPPRASTAGGVALSAAIEERFGNGQFKTAVLLSLAEIEPHSQIATAIARVIDMNAGAHVRAVALGNCLRNLPRVAIVGEQRGAKVYRIVETRETRAED